jgi:hypothetical protein
MFVLFSLFVCFLEMNKKLNQKISNITKNIFDTRSFVFNVNFENKNFLEILYKIKSIIQ